MIDKTSPPFLEFHYNWIFSLNFAKQCYFISYKRCSPLPLNSLALTIPTPPLPPSIPPSLLVTPSYPYSSPSSLNPFLPPGYTLISLPLPFLPQTLPPSWLHPHIPTPPLPPLIPPSLLDICSRLMNYIPINLKSWRN